MEHQNVTLSEHEPKAKFPALEEELLSYVQNIHSKGCTASNEMLRDTALKIAKSHNIPTDEFKASYCWLRNFMKRNEFLKKRRTTLADKLPEEYTHQVLQFQKYVIRLRKKKHYDLCQIGNADKISIDWDLLASDTIVQEMKSVTIQTTGNEKLKCTVMLAITADEKKLPPYVILKRESVPKNLKVPGEMLLRAQSNGYIEESLVLDWLKEVWSARPGGLRRENNILVWNSSKAQLTDMIMKEMKNWNTDVVVIPKGLTSLLQPLTVCIKKPFKGALKRKYCDWMDSGSHTSTPAGEIRKASVQSILDWIHEAWDEVETITIQKSFKKCSISNSMDASEDDYLWNSTNSEESSDDLSDSSEG